MMGKKQSPFSFREPPVGARRCGRFCVTGPWAAAL